MRMSGGRRARFRRSSAGVSPVRLATRDVRRRLAESGGGEADAGERRPEVPLDVVGQGLERARCRGRGPCRAAPWSAARAAWRRGGRGSRGTRRGSCRCRSGRGSACGGPAEIAAQPSAWACVGASNVASNQARTAGLNGASGSAAGVAMTTGEEYRRDTAFRPHVRFSGRCVVASGLMAATTE